MSRHLRTLLLSSAALLALTIGVAARTPQTQDPPKAPAKPVDVAGKWDMALEMSIGSGTPTLEIKQDGTKITGTYTGRYGAAPITGEIAERTLTFTCTIDAEGQSATMNFRGDVASDGQTMKGSAEIEGLGDATWTAKRAKALPH